MKFTLIFLIFAFSNLTHAVQNMEVECSGKSRFNTLKLKGNDVLLYGTVNWGYNSAQVACRKFGISELLDKGLPFVCAGPWYIGYDKNGALADAIVKVNFRKDPSGSISGDYVMDYDQRPGSLASRLETFTCTIHRH